MAVTAATMARSAAVIHSAQATTAPEPPEPLSPAPESVPELESEPEPEPELLPEPPPSPDWTQLRPSAASDNPG